MSRDSGLPETDRFYDYLTFLEKQIFSQENMNFPKDYLDKWKFCFDQYKKLVQTEPHGSNYLHRIFFLCNFNYNFHLWYHFINTSLQFWPALLPANALENYQASTLVSTANLDTLYSNPEEKNTKRKKDNSDEDDDDAVNSLDSPNISYSEKIYSDSTKPSTLRARIKHFLFVESANNKGEKCWTIFASSKSGLSRLGKTAQPSRQYRISRCHNRDYKVHITPRSSEALYQSLIKLDTLYNKGKKDDDKIEKIPFADRETWLKEFIIIDADIKSFKVFYEKHYATRTKAVFFKFKSDEAPDKIAACLKDLERRFEQNTTTKRKKRRKKKNVTTNTSQSENSISSEEEKEEVSTLQRIQPSEYRKYELVTAEDLKNSLLKNYEQYKKDILEEHSKKTSMRHSNHYFLLGFPSINMLLHPGFKAEKNIVKGSGPNQVIAILKGWKSYIEKPEREAEPYFIMAENEPAITDLQKNLDLGITYIHDDNEDTFSNNFTAAAINDGNYQIKSCIDILFRISKNHKDVKARIAVITSRPAGHHSQEITFNDPKKTSVLHSPSLPQSLGFCHDNKVCWAAQYAVDTKVLDKNTIVIIDIDVHDGNGTRNFLLNRWQSSANKVFFINIFGAKEFPYLDTQWTPVSSGKDNVEIHDIPFVADSTEEELDVTELKPNNEEVLEKITEKLQDIKKRPGVTVGFILISLGLDSCIHDPLNKTKAIRVSEEFYSEAMILIQKTFNAPILLNFEGGYHLLTIENVFSKLPYSFLPPTPTSVYKSRVPIFNTVEGQGTINDMTANCTITP